MARDFTKNVSNYMSLGINQLSPLLNGLAAISVHAWIKIDTADITANNNRILSVGISDTAAGLIFSVHDGTALRIRVGGRSVSTDTFQVRNGTTTLPTTGFISVGGVLNFAGDTITPYYAGVAEGGGAVTFANSSYTNGTPTTLHDMIGADISPPSTTLVQLDGRISELSIYNIDIGASNFALLAAGHPASLVSSANLIWYKRLLGNVSPETSEIGGLTGTITGSIPQATHPFTVVGGLVNERRNRLVVTL